MPYSPRTIQTAIKDVLNNANATAASYDLSTGLLNRIQKVEMGRPVNRPISKFETSGFVMVYTEEDEEEVAQMGATAPRQITSHFGILGAIEAKPMSGGDTQRTHDVGEEQCQILAANIKTVLRNNIRLSNTVDWSVVTGTEYNANVSGFEPGKFVVPVVVTLETHKLST